MPTLAEIIADDWQYIDDIKDATLKTPALTDKVTQAAKVLNGTLTQTPAGNSALLIDEPQTTVFHLWVSTIVPSTVEPELNDVLTVESENWTIQKRQLTTLDTRWKLTCTKQL